jgi:hypothetical protein
MTSPELSAAEAERQLAAATERHDEVVAAMQVGDTESLGHRPAVRALARGIQLVSFTLQRASSAGVPLERLVELSGWEESTVRAALARGPESNVVESVAPGVEDAGAVAREAAGFEATARVDALLQRILADVAARGFSQHGGEVDDLCERLETAWRAWRDELGD